MYRRPLASCQGPAGAHRVRDTRLCMCRGYLTWAAGHPPPMGGSLHLPGPGRHPAKGIPKLGQAKGKKAIVKAPPRRAVPAPASPRRTRSRRGSAGSMLTQRSADPPAPAGKVIPSSNPRVIGLLGGSWAPAGKVIHRSACMLWSRWQKLLLPL